MKIKEHVTDLSLKISGRSFTELAQEARLGSMYFNIDESRLLAIFEDREEKPRLAKVNLFTFEDLVKAHEIETFFLLNQFKRPSLRAVFEFANQYVEMQQEHPLLGLVEVKGESKEKEVTLGVYGYRHTKARFVDMVPLFCFLGNYYSIAV